jgi:hypothetical protein
LFTLWLRDNREVFNISVKSSLLCDLRDNRHIIKGYSQKVACIAIKQ